MDLLSGDIEAIAVKTWFWKSQYKNPETNRFSLKFYDYKDFNTLGLVILTSSKTSEYGKLIMAEECIMDDSADKIIYRLPVVLTYTEKEKHLSIEIEFIKRKGEKFYIYFVEDIKTSNLSKITCTFSEMKPPSETVAETGLGERNANVESKENIAASNQRRPNITRNIVDNWRSLTSILSKELYRGFLKEMHNDVILNVRDQRYVAHKVIPQDPSSTLKEIGGAERDGAITIANCNADILKIFLLYLSTGTVDNMSRENVFDLYFMAKRYNLKLLERKCKHRIEMYCPNC